MSAQTEKLMTQRPLGSDLILAILSLLIFLLLAGPILAQTKTTESTEFLPGTYVSPPVSPKQDKTPKTKKLKTTKTKGSSQSQRSANSNNSDLNNSLEVQPMPECEVDDT